MKAPLKTFIAGAMALSLGACGISPEERMERAEQAFEEHRFSEARLDLGILLQLDENDSQALDLLARIQLAMGQGGAVAATLGRLERTGVDLADANLLAAEGHLQSGNVEAAGDLIGDATSAESWRLSALVA